MSTLIMFVCVAPGHARVNRDTTSQNLTIHAGGWAVCPAGFPDGHVWAETHGLDYGDLFRKRVAETDAGARA